MRLLFIIAAFVSLSAEGQIINASPPYRSRAVAAPSCVDELIDTYTGAEAAFSLRKLSSAYSGSAIRVRESGGNTESDIGFAGSCGDLDTNALKTFVGANSGYVVTWYDQSGNGLNVTQATTGYQPRIVNAGAVERLSGRPSINFAGAPSYLYRADFTNGASAATLYLVGKVNTDPPTCNACGAWLENNGNGTNSHTPFADGNIYDGWYTGARKATGNPSESLTSTFLYCAISASGDWRSYVNNSLHYSTGTNTVGSSSGFFIGASLAPTSYYFSGNISEVIVYESASSDGDRNGISGNINTYYTIY